MAPSIAGSINSQWRTLFRLNSVAMWGIDGGIGFNLTSTLEQDHSTHISTTHAQKCGLNTMQVVYPVTHAAQPMAQQTRVCVYTVRTST